MQLDAGLGALGGDGGVSPEALAAWAAEEVRRSGQQWLPLRPEPGEPAASARPARLMLQMRPNGTLSTIAELNSCWSPLLLELGVDPFSPRRNKSH